MAVSVRDPGARDRVERWLLWSVASLRGVQYATSAPALVAYGVTEHSEKSTAVVTVYLLGVTWSAWMFTSAVRRDHVPTWVVTADVLVVCGVQTVVPATLGVDRDLWLDWTYGPAIGVMVFVLLCRIGRGRWLAGLPVVSWALTHFIGGAPGWPDIVGGVIGMIAYAVLGAGVIGFVRGLARASPRAPLDSALATLQMIAGGALDLRADDVRDRCQQDADSLRGLLMSDRGDGVGDLIVELSAVLRDPSLRGLRVHPLFDAGPAEVPGPVTAATVAATRKALANVVDHARTDEAWLTAISTPEGGVSVTVVDRGVGFDREDMVITSLLAIMADVNGQALVDSAPGQGTTVELTWTP
ncbi:Two-component system, sensor protein [Alloactinosynnema sp. L-07]|uniref:ATP-binding protein n=1 Tax=Alloactinosynnema sp. L-07 TaxID=1653480 RepID=UPI00065EF211|nr:ATP-binding protein [Alloactinosynnema sp. L-07]CRK56533.1 Two-component system, sensor protein [Alloactinosynnema sp. L-07]